jgi:tetratricopeptide (TPR) repeat protein
MTRLSVSLTALLLANASHAFAQDATPSQTLQLPPTMQQPTTAVAPALPAITNDAMLDEKIRKLQTRWAEIKYRSAEAVQEAEMKMLAVNAQQLVDACPSYAEPKIWAAIILSTQAGFNGGLGSLGLIDDAKALLESAQAINPNALDGSIYTSLGSLYYKAPPWPVSFGDDDKARAYLEQARALNPTGIDANYFYGDFLIEQGEYANAVTVLKQALQAPARIGRELADEGRRKEIQDDIKKAEAGLKG